MPSARRFALALPLLLAACSSEDAAPGPYPYPLVRTDAGDPVSAEELAAVTDLYLDTLVGLDYFRSIAHRAIGWPKSDPEGRPWYGSWWSGVRIQRTGREVTFLHSHDGADNNGMRTGPMLEGACYAYALWQHDEHAALVHALDRGFTANILAMERTSAPAAPTLLTRAFYPQNITYEEGGLKITLDFSQNWPGEDNGATQYVHLADNPHWGDIWVKNKRSKDDLGHMLRAIGALESCRSLLPAEVVADDAQMLDRYGAFARQVEADGFRIATWDKDLNVWIPNETLAIFVQEFDTECNAVFGMRVLGHGDAGGHDCKNGVTEADQLVSSVNDVRHIFFSFHEAAVQLALRAGLGAPAATLASGLALRSDQIHDALARGEPPGQFEADDFAGDLAHFANAGVPLTWREVRTLHDAIRAAHDAYLSGANERAVHAFDPDGADGEYGFDFAGAGLQFRDLGVLLGTCASKWRNPTSKPVLDCDRVRAAAARF